MWFSDIRKTPHVKGRSINLSMSNRAWAALSVVGLKVSMADHGLPMQGRMIHPLMGPLKPILYDKRSKQVSLTFYVKKKKFHSLKY